MSLESDAELTTLCTTKYSAGTKLNTCRPIGTSQNQRPINAPQDILESTLEFKEGQYHVGLLWKNKPDLPNNFPLAFKQLKALVKQLERDPESLEKYTATIDEDLKKRLHQRGSNR